MSHHHYEDVIDNKATNDRIRKIEEEKKLLDAEKEEILEAEELKETKAWQLSADIQELKEQREWMGKEITKKKLELAKLCTHEKIRTENRNYPGGYLDKAEYWTDYFCVVCGIKVDEKVEYGGFG